MIDSIVSFIQKILGVLPQDPFRPYIDELAIDIQSQAWVGILNYFIPLKEMLEIASVWLVAVGIYMVVRIFLKKFSG